MTADTRKAQARAWFENLRDRIMVGFEALEDQAPAHLYPGAHDWGYFAVHLPASLKSHSRVFAGK